MDREMPFDIRFQPPRIQMKTIKWIVIGLILLIFLLSTFFTVGPEEVGVVQRFWKKVRNV
jgi:regulator of protease activity HflC (stomatin/prohibitin superfamily)